MKKFVGLVAVVLLSVSCVELKGNLQVRHAFEAKKQFGFLNSRTKIIRIDPGSYRAELISKNSKNLKLELSGGSLDNVEIPIKSDSNLNIPSNGTFFIEGAKIGQPFNVSGNIRTDIERYGYTNAVEKCQRQLTERKCEKVCKKESHQCEIVCDDVIVTINGFKNVSYHYKDTHRQANLEFRSENSTELAAILPVAGVETDKVVDWESECR